MIDRAIVVSDLHCGCQYGLCPARGVHLDGGGWYRPSDGQRKLWAHWRAFGKWACSVCEGKPCALVVNGDSLDGRHHGATTQASQNLTDQARIALECLETLRDMLPVRAIYVVRGTEAHVGPSAESEEALAIEVGALPDHNGNYARNEVWLRLGDYLAHFAHAIGVTGSQAYETTALCKEAAETNADAARWGYQPPDWIVRSHRHRHAEVRLPSRHVRQTVITTPGWQMRSGYAYRGLSGRTSLPQFGGVALIAGSAEPYSRACVYPVEREPPEVCE